MSGAIGERPSASVYQINGAELGTEAGRQAGQATYRNSHLYACVTHTYFRRFIIKRNEYMRKIGRPYLNVFVLAKSKVRIKNTVNIKVS